MKYLRISLARLTASRFRLTRRRRKMFDRTDDTSFDRRIRDDASTFSRTVPLPPNLRIPLFTGKYLNNFHDKSDLATFSKYIRTIFNNMNANWSSSSQLDSLISAQKSNHSKYSVLFLSVFFYLFCFYFIHFGCIFCP